VDAPAGIGPGAGAGGMSETVGGAMAGLRVVVPETRELEVLALITAGGSNKAIASTLSVSVSTVRTHINNLYGKLEVRSRTQAVAKARATGLL